MRYTRPVLLLLAGVIVAAWAVFRLTRDMDTSQRIVAAIVLVMALIYLARKAMDLGLLGRRTA